MASTSAGPSSQATSLRLRSCLPCRRRKVRCDKEMPCSTCMRGQIPCLYPVGREPRCTRSSNYATQPGTIPPPESQLLERVKTLENMIEKLRGVVEISPRSKTGSTSSFDQAAPELQPRLQAGSPDVSSGQDPAGQDVGEDMVTGDPDASVQAQDLHNKLGRLVLHEDSVGTRYVSDGFWAKLDEEVLPSPRILCLGLILLTCLVELYPSKITRVRRRRRRRRRWSRFRQHRGRRYSPCLFIRSSLIYLRIPLCRY